MFAFTKAPCLRSSKYHVYVRVVRYRISTKITALQAALDRCFYHFPQKCIPGRFLRVRLDDAELVGGRKPIQATVRSRPWVKIQRVLGNEERSQTLWEESTEVGKCDYNICAGPKKW